MYRIPITRRPGTFSWDRCCGLVWFGLTVGFPLLCTFHAFSFPPPPSPPPPPTHPCPHRVCIPASFLPIFLPTLQRLRPHPTYHVHALPLPPCTALSLAPIFSYYHHPTSFIPSSPSLCFTTSLCHAPSLHLSQHGLMHVPALPFHAFLPCSPAFVFLLLAVLPASPAFPTPCASCASATSCLFPLPSL